MKALLKRADPSSDGVWTVAVGQFAPLAVGGCKQISQPDRPVNTDEDGEFSFRRASWLTS
jgi:hypothetical protein